MSMVICEDCDAAIDSDHDAECFVETGNMRRLHQTTVLCENCRERRWDRQQEDMSSEPPASVQEQYVNAWHEKQRLR